MINIDQNIGYKEMKEH